ncbi:hypothetical protein A2U01_0102016, partial [Trifolium medium]|nr:hypothetical protein [Trifolium medium]
SPELERATSEAEKIHEDETSPASEAASPEQQIPEQNPQPIPEQNPEQIPADPVIQNSPEPDKLAKFENFRPDFS